MTALIKENFLLYDHCVHEHPVSMKDYHYHNSHELYYLEKGYVQYFVGDKVDVLHPGDFIFVPMGVFHRANYKKSICTIRHLFSLDASLLQPAMLPYLDGLFQMPHFSIVSGKSFLIQDLLLRMQYECSQQEKGISEMLLFLVSQLLIYIERYKKPAFCGDIPDSCQIIQNAAQFISSHPDQEHRLESLAQKYHLSPSYFSRLFKKITGTGLNQYIVICKINRAEQMLRESNCSITEVATSCGFNNSNYFAHVFKGIKGITPKKFAGSLQK